MSKPRGICEQPKTRAIIEAMVLDGAPDTAIATKIGVSRQAIRAFRHRHSEHLAPAIASIEKQIEDYAIASKVARIAALQDRHDRMRRLIEARAGDERYSDEPGYETGLMVHQLKAVGRGDDFQLVDLYVTDNGLLSEMRATERAAADELGAIPQAAPNITVNDNRQYTIVREVHTTQQVSLG